MPFYDVVLTANFGSDGIFQATIELVEVLHKKFTPLIPGNVPQLVPVNIFRHSEGESYDSVTAQICCRSGNIIAGPS